jgi:hypothetical protein
MTFDDALAQVLDLRQREGRVSYRALKRRFALDDDYLGDVKAELIQAKRLARDEDGVVLVWGGAAPVEAAGVPPEAPGWGRDRPAAERRQLTVLFRDVVEWAISPLDDATLHQALARLVGAELLH